MSFLAFWVKGGGIGLSKHRWNCSNFRASNWRILGKPSTLEVQVSTDVVGPAGLVEQLYSELEEKVRVLRPKEDFSPLEKAYRMAAEAHKDQIRESGEPYMVHPLNVTLILADMQMDMVCLETGLLHDTVEDTSLSLDQIRKEFGEEVARCVDGVTKLSKLHLYSREERQAESVRKMLLAMVNDIRVIIVKLADRLHNMRTLQVAASRAPAAHRAGDDRDLRAHRAPAGNGQNPRRTGGSFVPVSGAGGLGRADSRDRVAAPAERRVPEQDAARRGSESARAKAFRRAWKAASSAPTRCIRR